MPSSHSHRLWRFPLLFLALATSTLAQTTSPSIYHDGWIDLNKNGKQDPYENPALPIDQRIDDLLAQMNVDEKTCQLVTLYGYGRYLKDPLPTPGWTHEIWKDGIANIDELHNGAGMKKDADRQYTWPPSKHVDALNTVQKWFIEQTRLGIPVDFTNEGVRGLASVKTTNFPAPIGLGATWDRALISDIGRITGHEAKAWGYTNVYSPIVDLARDPRWGRVMDCYGEDPYLVAELAIRQAGAMQKQGIAATAKHFAVHSEPKGGRDGVNRSDPHIAPREMEALYMYSWERLVREAGLLGAMASYNDYDGIPIAGSHEFMIDRLRTQWGFQGYIVSDSGAVENLHKQHRVAATYEDAVAMYIAEGGNVRTMFDSPEKFLTPLRQALKDGKLSTAALDARVRDVLRVKFLLGLFDHPYADPKTADAENHTSDSQAVALKAARESIVLLKNANSTLPLSKTTRKILVCGPTADLAATSISRYGSQGGSVITLLGGIRDAVGPSGQVTFSPGCTLTDARWPYSELDYEPPAGKDADLITDAVNAAKDADVIVLGLGDGPQTIGEAKSRTSLDLPGFQTDLAKALSKTGKPLIVVLLTGRPASINWIDAHASAVLEAWFPGESGGKAVADVLFGDYTPGGKLAVTFPRTVGQLPFNFPYKPGSQDPGSAKDSNNGTSGALIDRPLYPFGFGLSYTTFEYADLSLSAPSMSPTGSITASVTLKNTGDRPGDEIVQFYVEQLVSSVTTYNLNLRGFERVALSPGESKRVTFPLPASALEIITRSGQRQTEPGPYKIMIGASSADIRLKTDLTITPNNPH